MKLAIFFPGIGYHCDKPLLYYARKLAQECGYDENIFLSYSYNGGNIRGDEKKMQQAFEALYEQAAQQLAGIEAGEDVPFFLCKELIPGYLDGVTGEYGAPKGYYVDEKEVETFDKLFSSKEKKKLPGQIF